MGVCDNASSPINIVTNVGPCDLKCKYSYNYPQMKLSAYNRGEYLEFETNSNNAEMTATTSSVNYNNSWYEVSEIRIYAPSIHRYGDKKATGEMLIIHKGMTSAKPLIISVPIQDVGSVGGAMVDLDAMISAAVTLPASEWSDLSTGVPVNLTSFTLNDIVPEKSFFSYTGRLPFNPPECNSDVDFVVFNINESISLSSNTAGLLNKNITDPVYPIKETNNRLYFNKSGATKSLSSSGGDGIYIDCQPTGEAGKSLVEQDTTGIGYDIGEIRKILNSSLMKKILSIGTSIIIGAVLMAILWFIGTKLVSFGKTASGAGVGGSGTVLDRGGMRVSQKGGKYVRSK